jgi:hypothetical protein
MAGISGMGVCVAAAQVWSRNADVRTRVMALKMPNAVYFKIEAKGRQTTREVANIVEHLAASCTDIHTNYTVDRTVCEKPGNDIFASLRDMVTRSLFAKHVKYLNHDGALQMEDYNPRVMRTGGSYYDVAEGWKNTTLAGALDAAMEATRALVISGPMSDATELARTLAHICTKRYRAFTFEVHGDQRIRKMRNDSEIYYLDGRTVDLQHLMPLSAEGVAMVLHDISPVRDGMSPETVRSLFDTMEESVIDHKRVQCRFLPGPRIFTTTSPEREFTRPRNPRDDRGDGTLPYVYQQEIARRFIYFSLDGSVLKRRREAPSAAMALECEREYNAARSS